MRPVAVFAPVTNVVVTVLKANGASPVGTFKMIGCNSTGPNHPQGGAPSDVNDGLSTPLYPNILQDARMAPQL